MGVFSGPDLKEDGLVLALDGANYKSFKGESTVNLASDPKSVITGYATIIPTRLDNQTLNFDGTLTAGLLSGTGWLAYTSAATTNGNRYTASWYVKAGTNTSCQFSWGGVHQGNATNFDFNLISGAVSNLSLASGENYGVNDFGNGWWRVWYSSTLSSGNNFYPQLNNSSTGTMYLGGIQIEQKAYPTSFVNGTRGTTVATGGGWADLIGNGNHGELVNGVREDSANGGSLVFDGTNDYVNSNLTLGTDATIEFVAKANWNQNNSGQPIPISINSDNYSSGPQPFFSSNRINWNTGDGASNPFSNSYIPDTNWHIFCISNNFSSGVATLYIDGVLIGTATALNMTTTGSNKLWIGRWHDGGYLVNMNLSSVKIYNRALTASEIQQNFNATRSRFGI